MYSNPMVSHPVPPGQINPAQMPPAQINAAQMVPAQMVSAQAYPAQAHPVQTYHAPMKPHDTSIASDIARAINGQYSAIICYGQLAGMAPNKEHRKIIEEIRGDEIRHLQTFSQIYAALTGRQAVPQQTGTCPADYREGLLAAFRDEQETVDFYLDIAEKAGDGYTKEQFRRAAADEQNHAVWFLYFLTAGS